MRIMFWENNPMWIYGLPNGFRDLNHQVVICEALSEFELMNIITKFKPEMVVTVGWTQATTGSRVDLIRRYVKKYKIPNIYWATEDPTHTFSFTLPLIQRLQPDFVFTICKRRVEYFRKLGVKAAHLDFGFHPKINHFDVEDKYKCSVAVVANGYSRILKKYPCHYRIESIKMLLKPLIRENIRIDFWGKGWEGVHELLGESLPEEWLHGSLPYTESCKVYSSAKITLGIQNHLTQMTQRNYEILGSGGFLLANDTPELRRLFKPNFDLVVSSSEEETLELVKYYLNNDEKREIIRKQGELSVRIHSYTNRAKYMLDVLREEKVIL